MSKQSNRDRIALAAADRELSRVGLADTGGFFNSYGAWYMGVVKQKYPSPNGMTADGFARESWDLVSSFWDDEMTEDLRSGVTKENALAKLVQRHPALGNALRDMKKHYTDGNW